MEENNNNIENEIKNNSTQPEENENNGPSIWVLLLGIFLLIRGVMRFSEDELGVLGIIMIVVGIANIIYYLVKKM